MSINIVDVTKLREIAEKAGETILPIYRAANFSVALKNDRSPLTEADMVSHHFIYDALSQCYPHIPIISEESHEQFHYRERKKFQYFFLVDPLDGTKEFIKKNGEFTVNIALIHDHRPIAGVIHAPVLGISYYAEEKKGAFKYENHQHFLLKKLLPNESTKIHALVSRSHRDEKTEMFLQKLRDTGKEVKTISAGSALKFGLIAEGKAHIYPRFSPSMEWDTAAGHLLINEVGKTLLTDAKLPLLYNKQSLLNPGFVVG